jgi:hypothetical protein
MGQLKNISSRITQTGTDYFGHVDVDVWKTLN